VDDGDKTDNNQLSSETVRPIIPSSLPVERDCTVSSTSVCYLVTNLYGFYSLTDAKTHIRTDACYR